MVDAKLDFASRPVLYISSFSAVAALPSSVVFKSLFSPALYALALHHSTDIKRDSDDWGSGRGVRFFSPSFAIASL